MRAFRSRPTRARTHRQQHGTLVRGSAHQRPGPLRRSRPRRSGQRSRRRRSSCRQGNHLAHRWRTSWSAIATIPSEVGPAVCSCASRASRIPGSPAAMCGFHPIARIKRAAIKKIELSGGGRDAVTATANAAKPDELALENVPEKRLPDTFKVGRLATLIANFAFQDVRKRSKPADDPRRMVADVEGGLRFVVTEVGEPAQGWVQISVEATDDAEREKA